jgi:hypothetical protein
MKKVLLLILNLVFVHGISIAQLTGIKTIPGDYISMASAVSALNANGVGAGGVTFNIASGYTETGNFTITASGTVSNPIVFQKSGAGANPIFTAGTGTGWDAVFKMVGSDYITFNGITVQENATNLLGNYIQKTEFGFAFFKTDYTNGCQHNTIANCTISLDRTFLENDPAPNTHMAIGIYMYNRDAAYNWINQESTVAGTHSYNTFTNNTISNVGMGIQIYGYHNTTSSLAIIERHNVISNNTISDVGGFNSMAFGINIQYAANTTITGNNITTHVSHQSGCAGIQYSPLGLSGVLINNNTIQVNATQINAFTTVQFGITVANGSNIPADPGWQTIEINNNNILAANANRGYTGINCQYNIAAFCTVENNNISMTTHPSYDGTSYGIQIQNWWSHITQVSIKNNIVKEHISALAQLYAISCEDNTDVFNVEGNKVINNNGAIIRGIYMFGETGSLAQKNIIDCGPVNIVSQFTGIQIAGINNSAVNNLIACRATSNTSTVHFGIASSIYTTTGNKVHHNTVYLDGGNNLGPNYSTCISLNSSGLLTEMHNNIFINKMQAGSNTPGYISAFFNYHNVASTNFKSHHNIFYAGSPSLRNSIYNYGVGINLPSSIDSNILSYKLRVCDKDSNSMSGDIEFLSFDPIDPNYLHVNTSNASLAHNNGKALATVTTDVDNNVRSASTPDIGADEFAGTTASPTVMQTPPVLWLKADAGVYQDAGVSLAMDGQNVQQWNDQSCNGFNASQPDATKRPTWQQYAFNGKPALWFDGVNGNYWLENTVNTPVATAGSARTYFVVAKAACNASGIYMGGHLFTNRRNAVASTLEFVKNGNNGIFHGGNFMSNHPQATSVNFEDGQKQPFVGTWTTEGTNTNLNFWFNGVAATTANANFMEDNSTSLGYCVGDRRDAFQFDTPNGQYDWQGHIAEIIVYDRVLSATERQAVESYLQQKYITTPSVAQFNDLPSSTTSSTTTYIDAIWKHPYNIVNNTQALVSIKDNCLELGTINSNVYVEANPVQIGTGYAMRRHYTINTSLNPAGTKRVRLYYTDADYANLQTMVPSLTSHSQLVVTKYDGPAEDGIFNTTGGSLTFIPSAQITTGTAFGQRYLEFDVTGFSEFWIHTGSVPLPVDILTFHANPCNTKACLQWTVGEEKNVSHYEVERSLDGKAFQFVGKVNATNESSYSFTDNMPYAGRNYYRLNVVDIDGKHNYSPIRSIDFTEGQWNIAILPTYSENGQYTLQSNKSIRSVEIFTTNGSLVQTIHNPSQNLNLSGLSSGLYFIRVNTSTDSEVLKVMR